MERTRRAEHHRSDRRQHEQRHERLPGAQSSGQHAVDRTGGRQSDGGGYSRAKKDDHAPDGDVVQHEDGGSDDHLEQEQLDRDRGGLAEEDRAAVETRQTQPIACAIGFLDRERPPDREHDGEEHRGPEQPWRGLVQQRAVGVERKREQHHDDATERDDLLERDPRPALDAQILARDEQGVAQEAHARASTSATTGSAVGAAALTA